MNTIEQKILIDKLSQLLEKQYGSKVKRIETHISTLLLVDALAFKIKKPVDFGFVDFSSLEKRKHFCHEELRLNSRLAKDLYHRVIAITGSAETPSLQETSTPIEYMIEMQRFAEGQEFNQLLSQGQLQTKHIDQLATLLAEFHHHIATANPSQRYGTPQSVEAACLQNFTQIHNFQSHLSATLTNQLNELKKWTQNFLTEHVALLKKRFTEGFVKECHGDLHLGNITLLNNKITIFDGIEFNDDFRWIDVISDLAFILMDLHYHQRSDLAWQMLSQYLDKTGDHEGVTLLRFYLVYRAMVRAKVNALRLGQIDTHDQEYSATLKTITRHINLASKLAKQHAEFLMITHGVSGSGKSWQSSMVLKKSGAIRLRSDVERQRLEDLQTRRYTDDNRNKVYELMLSKANTLIQAGFSVILDATYLAQAHRQAACELAEKRNIAFKILHTEATIADLEKRLIKRQRQGHDASEANIAVLHSQLDTQEPLTTDEKNYLYLADD